DPFGQLVPERFDDVTEAGVRPVGAERADRDGDGEYTQPGQPGARPAGQETVVHGPGGQVAGEQRGQRLRGRPAGEPAERAGPAAQRGGGEPDDATPRVASTGVSGVSTGVSGGFVSVSEVFVGAAGAGNGPAAAETAKTAR